MIKSMSTDVMIQKIAEYFKTQPVLKAWLFGSYSRGEERPDSDVDILFVPCLCLICLKSLASSHSVGCIWI